MNSTHGPWKILCLITWLSLLWSFGADQDLLAQPKLIEPVSRALWGSSYTNCSDGSYLYLGAGGTLIIGRIVSADSIDPIGEYYFPSTIQDLTIYEQTLFVSDLLTGLHVMDISDAGHPQEVGKLSFTHRSYGQWLYAGDLFVSHGDDGVSKVDVGNRELPVLTGEATFPCTRLRAYLEYIYCVNLDRVTIMERTTMDSVGVLPVRRITPFVNMIIGLEFSSSKGMIVESHFGDLPGAMWSYVTLLDVSTPSHPMRRGSLLLPPQTSFKNQGERLFCLGEDTLFTVDADSIDGPQILSRTCCVVGDYVSITDSMLFASRVHPAEFQMVDIKHPDAPKIGLHLSTLADVYCVSASDSFLVSGGYGQAGLMLADLRDVSYPKRRLPYTDSIGSVKEIKTGNGRVFAATDQGLKVFDVVGCDSLKLIGGLNYGAKAARLDLADTLVAIGGEYSPVHLISVADPANPRYLLDIPSSWFGYSSDIFLRDTLLFVCGDYAGVRISSVANPGQPVTLWEHYYDRCGAIYPLGTTLLVADDRTLRAFDITAPGEPVELGSYNCGRHITDIAVQDSVAFLAVYSGSYNADNGMLAIDIRSLSAMDPIAQAVTPGWSNAIFADAHHVFLSDNKDGVYIYDRDDMTTGISRATQGYPRGYSLLQNYPNPFNPETEIRFVIPRQTAATLRIYDVLGKEIATLFTGDATPGEHVVRWNASRYGSGVYFCRLQTTEYTESKKLLLLR